MGPSLNDLLIASTATAPPTALEAAESWVNIIGGIFTPLAVVSGAVWAYFKFYKERTYRPHIDVGISGEWLAAPGGLRITVTLKNIGKSKFDLEERGTGLMIQVPSGPQPPPPAEFSWDVLKVFPVFLKHQWIEPGESVTDELLIKVAQQPQIVQATARLVFTANPENIVVQARRVLHFPRGPVQGQEPKTTCRQMFPWPWNRATAHQGGEDSEAGTRGALRDQHLGIPQA